MRKSLLFLLLLATHGVVANEDNRQLVQLPEPMQAHMLGNMRDHLQSIDNILHALAKGDFDDAAHVAEFRLGMSSLDLHGASHMARFMPAPMQNLGTEMHRAASRFARTAEEGDAPKAYAALGEITRSCVACHSAYKLR